MAFVRCLRDPHPPARLAAINSLRSTQVFYPLQNTATQVMPALCHLTIDQEKKVRDEAFKLLKEFIDKVHRVSENPTVIDEIESELEVSYTNNSKFSNNLTSLASWAVSSFTSKLSKISTKATTNSSSSNSTTNSSSTNSSTQNLATNIDNGSIKKLNQQKTPNSMKLDKNSKQQNSDASDYEGWDLDDKPVDKRPAKENKSMNLKSIKNENMFDNKFENKSGWDVDDTDIDFKEENEKQNDNLFSKGNEFSNSYKQVKRIDDDSFNSLTPRNKSSTAITSINKSVNKNKTLEDELFNSLAEPSARKTQKKKAGAMKLGAKKA